MSNKIIAIPVSWMLYEVPDNIFAVLGAAITTPPILVLEALVEQGGARRVKLISEDIEIIEDVDEEDKPPGESPWWPGGNT